MKAAVLTEGPGPLEVTEIEIAQPVGREVLVRTAHAGLCHSDLHVMEGLLPYPMPVVMGHESAGVVEAVGDGVHDVAVGDHVITYLALFCGYCDNCLSGRPNICNNVRTLARGSGIEPRLSKGGTPYGAFAQLGSFAETMLVHENAVVKIREDMPLDAAALIGCGISTGLGAVLRRAKVAAGETIAVIGCGGVGLSAVQGGRIAGANRVIAVDAVASKLEMASTVGATDVVNAADGDPVAQVLELTGGAGVDYAFEAIGLKKTAEQAFAMAKRGGTAVLIGVMPAGQMLELHGIDVVLQEKTFMGSFMGSLAFRVDLPRFVDMYLDGRLLLDEMVSAHLKIDEVNDGFDRMKAGEVARAVIDF
jgi:S-(hydroxymethyl)glutathione dehydrogenase / alcohol dehydrogenase